MPQDSTNLEFQNLADWIKLRSSLAESLELKTWLEGTALFDKLNRLHAFPSVRRVKVAILSGNTTQFFAQMLKLGLFTHQIECEIYEAPFGNYQQEILDDKSPLFDFAPDFILLAVNYRDLNLSLLEQNPQNVIETILKTYRHMWKRIHGRLSASTILQTNFDTPMHDSLGNLSSVAKGGRCAIIRGINQSLILDCPSYVTIVDQNDLQASVGLNWHDESIWYSVRQHLSMSALPHLASYVAAIIKSQLGLSKKIVVLDLDNTLWGGLIGEDGLGDILLGPPSALGEAFTNFQSYLLELNTRGILLAVCSKNYLENAKAPFELHKGSILKLSNFCAFVANWNDKASNIKSISEALNLTLDSFVFVDDNPVERKLVRDTLPEVAVPEMPRDPALFVRALHKHRYFEPVSLTSEDFRRAETYNAKTKIIEWRTYGTSLDQFLTSLQMSCHSAPIDSTSLSRVAQLIAKTNEFNLTTRRHSQGELEKMAQSADFWTQTFSLTDRYIEYGIVGLMIIHRDSATQSSIDTWLMSCRVLGRTMEEFMMKELLDSSKKWGAKSILGEYIPTAKNKIASGLLSKFGFQPQPFAGTKSHCFHLDLSQSHPSPATFVAPSSAKVAQAS